MSQPSTAWPAGYERSARLRLATIGRRTGRTHEVGINFVVMDGHLFVTGVSNNRDWMKNVLKNPQVTVMIDGVPKPMRAERINSEERRVTIERLYRKKYGLGARLLSLARPGSFIFELSEPGNTST